MGENKRSVLLSAEVYMMDYIIAEYPEDGVFDTDTQLIQIQKVYNGTLPHKGDMIRFSKYTPATKFINYWCEVVTILHRIGVDSSENDTLVVFVKILNKQNNTSKE